MKKKPATPKSRALLAKLQALADRGINGERDAAREKLRRLKCRYDFSAEDLSGPDLFAGKFHAAPTAEPLLAFTSDEADIINQVKWAVENATGIRCLFRAGQLQAHARPATARKLAGIAATVTQSFSQLWKQFQSAPGIQPADRGNFLLGLYEGMMHEERHGEALPKRSTDNKPIRAKKRSLNWSPGIRLHPYAVAVGLGRQVRFCVPCVDLEAQLERTIKGVIGEVTSNE